MKKTVKLSLFAAGCCLSLGLCAGLGLIKHNSDVAMAKTPLITMVNGAAVRLPDKTLENGYANCGIRFSSIIDKTDYENLKENHEVTSGTFILPWSAYSANPVNEANCFAEDTAKYYWQIGVDSEGSPVYNTTQTEGKTLIYHSESTPELDGDNYRLNGSVVNLGDADMTGVRFVGVGYVKYANDTETNYEFATTNETNARSVAEVAQKLYYKTDAVTADDKTLTEGQKDDLALAYVQQYIDLYHEANGSNPTVEYTLNVNMETSKGFEGFEVQSVAELDSYDAKLPGTQTPIMLDGSSKADKYIYNSNTTSDSVSVSEDDLLKLNFYTAEEGVVSKSSDWSVDGTSLCIDFSKTSSAWHGFYGSNSINVGSGRYVSFVAYMKEGYPEFAGNAFWIDGSKSVEAKFTLDPGVPKRVEIDLGEGGYSNVKAFAFQDNGYNQGCKLYIDDVRFYNKTVESVPYNVANLPKNAVDITETIANATPYMYNNAHNEASVSLSSDWSADGKSQSVCFDFANATTTGTWMGVNVNQSLGSTYKYMSFTAYCESGYNESGGVWISTPGTTGSGDTIYSDFKLEAGVAKTFTYPLNSGESDLKIFTFKVPTDKNCKIYVDDIIVYSETAETKVPALDVTDKVASATEWSYHGTADGSVVVTKDEKLQAICIDFSNITGSNTWAGVNLNGYDLGATYKYMSFTAYCEQDYSMANALWISDEGQNSTIYTGDASEFALRAGVAKTFEWNYNSKKLSIFSLKPPTDKTCKIYISNIQFYNETEKGPDPGLYTQTIPNGEKTTVLAGFTSLITSTDKDVTLTMSIQTADGGEWTTLATEATKCALNHTVDLSALTYCKVKVVAVLGGATISEQVIDLITGA